MSEHGLQRTASLDSINAEFIHVEAPRETTRFCQLGCDFEYLRDISKLMVSTIQVKDLEKNEITGSQDSYVKVWLSPHKNKNCQTKVDVNTLNPVYKERFLFNIYPGELDNKMVQFQVFSSDKHTRHKLLGETELRLGDIDLRQPTRIWMNMRNMDQKPTDLGDIMFSLSYLPTSERLTVVVVKARDLKWSQNDCMDGDYFVKVHLLQNGLKVVKKKTSLRRGQTTPCFQQPLTFSVPATDLQTIQLQASIVEQCQHCNYLMGHVTVGSDVTGCELRHWNEMVMSMRHPVAMWHSLCK